MKGTVCTNGLTLNILAYDTTQLKPKADFKGKDDNDFMVDISQDLELEDGFLGTTVDEEQGEDSEWDYRIVNAMTFSQLDPGNPNKRETVKVTSRFLNFPVSRFRHFLAQRKTEYEIDALENSVPSFGRDTMEEFFRWASASETGSKSNLDKMQHFYENLWHLKKGWDLRKAQRATFDHVVQRVLRMLGLNGILVIGLGSFESSKGVPSSKHTAIMRHLIIQCENFLEAVYPRSKYCRACEVYFDRDAVGRKTLLGCVKLNLRGKRGQSSTNQ
ncbi:hypothetical protein BGZ65_007482 [Modicella reniformis]|uniref:Uncharacterized protein n=1 Tax=Modicella reniformis TaxID=1440133 RepID=A0A9P6IPW2_9FUNG|nr:hypothetical protein BGZ65_007482 [Modicella reniformis]